MTKKPDAGRRKKKDAAGSLHNSRRYSYIFSYCDCLRTYLTFAKIFRHPVLYFLIVTEDAGPAILFSPRAVGISLIRAK